MCMPIYLYIVFHVRSEAKGKTSNLFLKQSPRGEKPGKDKNNKIQTEDDFFPFTPTEENGNLHFGNAVEGKVFSIKYFFLENFPEKCSFYFIFFLKDGWTNFPKVDRGFCGESILKKKKKKNFRKKDEWISNTIIDYKLVQRFHRFIRGDSCDFNNKEERLRKKDKKNAERVYKVCGVK